MASRTRTSKGAANGAPTRLDHAREHYHREKARRATAPRPNNDLLEAAKREYLALLEAEAARGKGGRPKKKAAGRRRTADWAEPGVDERETNEESDE